MDYGSLATLMRAALANWLGAAGRPGWLQGMFWPTLMLWLYALGLALVTVRHPGGGLPPGVDYVSRAAFALIMAFWVTADARKRHRPLCYDYDGFVFFLWPVVVPVYLIRTRGWRALLTLLCFLGLWVVVLVAVSVTYAVGEFVFHD